MGQGPIGAKVAAHPDLPVILVGPNLSIPFSGAA
jgi:hypothetical protein